MTGRLEIQDHWRSEGGANPGKISGTRPMLDRPLSGIQDLPTTFASRRKTEQIGVKMLIGLNTQIT